MGLDNIPTTYPCVLEGTAVRVRRIYDINETKMSEPVISCRDTIEACGCPYARDREQAMKDGVIAEEGRVLGMFGTECWYRGKYGNYLANVLGLDYGSFYGQDSEVHKYSGECVSLADEMEEAYEKKKKGDGSLPDPEHPSTDLSSDIRYAIWWLRWVAEKADGCKTWY